MVRSFLCVLFKQARKHATYAVNKAFSAKYLLLTNGLVSAGMSGSADSLVQKVCRRHNNKSTPSETSKVCTSIDGARVCRMTVTGMVLGVIAHHWYIFLDKRYTGTTLRIVMKKTLIDQLVLGPICLLTFLGLLSILEGSYYKGFKSELYKKGPEMVAVDWLVYPPAQFINFKFLPSRFRVLYDCCITFALDIYYSHIKYER